jgi:AraC family transcriptional regulator, regulatory protein of adaptative response / DNA-3-methyladenine glycosylase II
MTTDGGRSLRLGFPGPLDWDVMLAYLAARAIKGVEHVADGVYRRTVVVGGDPGVIEVALVARGRLTITAHLPDRNALGHVVRQVRYLCNLDLDLAAANATLTRDPLLAAEIEARPGLRVPGVWDPFEVGVRAIIGQQVSVAGAGTMAGRLVERHGTAIRGMGQFGLTHLFPSPELLAGADLDGLGLTSARISAIRGFAGAVSLGSLRLDRSLALGELVSAVVALPGLGPWTAEYLALRMGEPDAFPAGDLGLRRAMERLSGVPITPRGLMEIAERWRPWRAHAAIHLWMSQW